MDNIYIKAIDLNSWITKYFKNKDLISIDDLISCIEDLDGEVEELKEKIEDLKEDIETNYTRIDYASQVRVSDSDFL